MDPRDTAARVAAVPLNSTIVSSVDAAGQPVRSNIRKLLAELEGTDAQKPFIGAVVNPGTGRPETNAGPGYLNRFVRGGMGEGEELASNLRRQAISRVKPGAKLDKKRLQSNITKGQLVQEREKRDARKRAEMRDTVTNRGRFITSEPIPGGLPSRLQEDAQFSARAAQVERERGEAEIARLRSGAKPQRELGGALARIEKQVASRAESPTQYYDGSGEFDVASDFSGRRAQQKADAGERKKVADALEREIVSRTMGQQRDRRRKIGIGAAALGGAALAGKGIYDLTRPEEEEIRYA